MPTDQIPPDNPQTALLFETDRAVSNTLSVQFQDRNWEIYSTDDAGQALSLLREHEPVVALVDMISPEVDGLDLAREMREISPELIIILFTGYPEPDIDVAEVHELIYTYLVKPVRIDQLSLVIARAQQELAVIRENLELKHQVQTLQDELVAARELAVGDHTEGQSSRDESLSRHKPAGPAEGGLARQKPSAIASYERQMYGSELGQRQQSPDPIEPEHTPDPEATAQEESSEEPTESSAD